jgi:YegS/Rv2252/BmrU family lipid kinase
MAEDPGWYVVVNPASGSGRSLRSWQSLAGALRLERVPFEAATSERPGHGEALAAAAVARGFRRLLAVGGDGTLHEVLNGAMRSPPADRLAFAVAPFGTGNDWARGRGVPREPLALARCLARGRLAPCDLGAIEFPADAASPPRYFINVAGAGIDAHVLATLPAGRARRIAYLWGVVRALTSFRAPQFEVEAAERRERGRRLLVLAANGPFCGNGMRLAPGATPDDGLLDVVTVEPLPLLSALARLGRLFDGRVTEEPWVHAGRASAVEVRAEPPAAVEADGQVVGRTPARFRAIPAAVLALDCRMP